MGNKRVLLVLRDREFSWRRADMKSGFFVAFLL